MIQIFSKHKLILIVIAAVIAGGVWFGMSGSSETPALSTTPTTSSRDPVSQELVATLLTLRAVKLDGTILADPAFLSLKDFSTEIVPEAVGRQNPFAPLPGGAAATGSVSAKIFTPRGPTQGGR